MTIRLENLADDGGRIPYSYSPHIATKNTAMLFRHIPENEPWNIPAVLNNKSARDTWDEDFKDWIKYLDGLESGLRISQKSASEKGISGDKNDFDAYMYFKASGLDVTDTTIVSIRRVFLSLMSIEGRQKYNFEEPDGVPNQEDIRITRTVVENFDQRNA